MMQSRWSQRRGVVAAALAVGVVATAAGAAEVDTTSEVVAQAQAAADAVTSYRADFTLAVFEEGTPTTLTGAITFQRPDKRRIEFSASRPADDVAQLVVSDGVTEWQYFPDTQTAYRTDWAALKAGGVPPETLEVRGLHQPFIDIMPKTLHLVETKTEGGKTLYVVEGKPTAVLAAEAPFPPGQVRITVEAATGLTQRLVMTDAQGREILTQSYANIQPNIEVEAGQFTFTPPDGTQVVEISEDRIRAAVPAPATGGSS